jgi:hypothetical protein
MNLLGMTYDNEKNSYSYNMQESAPSNCQILDYKYFSDIDLRGRFILFIGSVWAGLDMATANALAEFATKYTNTQFFFKLIIDDSVLSNVVPKEVVFTHLPIVLYIDNLEVKALSTGQTHKTELQKRIDKVLGANVSR